MTQAEAAATLKSIKTGRGFLHDPFMSNKIPISQILQLHSNNDRVHQVPHRLSYRGFADVSVRWDSIYTLGARDGTPFGANRTRHTLSTRNLRTV